jgi:hypothetical protein
MARPLWTGSIRFGLGTVPIGLPAIEAREELAFNLLHKRDGSRIMEKRFCKDEDSRGRLETTTFRAQPAVFEGRPGAPRPYALRGLVGATGFEPATTGPPVRCATGLRYAPRSRA